MKLKITTLIIVLFSAFASAFAQKADVAAKAVAPAADLPSINEILSRYVEAIGGREANQKIKSRESKGNVELSPMGITGDYTSIADASNRSITRMNLKGIGEMKEGTDGKIAWSDNPIQGGREKTGNELRQSQLLGNFYREINLDKLYSRMTVVGKETVDGKDAYVVEAVNEGLPVAKYYFDSSSGYLLRSDTTIMAPEGNQQATTFYEDMREVDGVKLPFKVRTRLPQMEIIVSTTEVTHDVKVEDSIFARPR